MRNLDRGFSRRNGLPACILAIILLTACAEPDAGDSASGTELVEVASVGVLEGAAEEVFGRVEDVRAGEDGSFFVFDGQSPSVAWFSSDGEYLGGVRATGEGPGELSRPLAIAVSRPERLAVLDPGNGRMSLFRTSTDGLGYERQLATTWGAALGSGRGFCAVGDRFFAVGPQGEHILHEIDEQGEVRRSFGQVEEASEAEYGPFAQLVVPQVNTGPLLCAEEAGLLLVARAFSSRVQAYTVAGELEWESEIADIHPRRIVLTDRGLGSESTTEGGSHELRSLAPWTENTVLVQYEWRPSDRATEGEQIYPIASVELRLSDGVEVARSSDLPRVADVQDGRIFSFENLPYPKVRVFERR